MNYTQRCSLAEGGGMEENERDRQGMSSLPGCCRACGVPRVRATADPAGEGEGREVSAQSWSALPCRPLHTPYQVAYSSLHIPKAKQSGSGRLSYLSPLTRAASQCSPSPASFNCLQTWGCHRFPSETTLKPCSSCYYSANAPKMSDALPLHSSSSRLLTWAPH